MNRKACKVVIAENGPYLVSGGVPLALQVIVPDADGASWDWAQGRSFQADASYTLCRCGASKTKPFCDGSHTAIGFDGTDTASREAVARQSDTFEGPALMLSDDESLCAFARFCDPGGKIWSLVERTDDPAARALVIREANHCPAGRLVVYEKTTHKAIEEPLPPSIGVVEDPVLGCSGPLWVRGGIPVESEDGTRYEPRNRVTLCRCGASSNKPFCDGSHASIKFDDGLVKK